MISDTISDAAEEIRRYLSDFPEAYAQQRSAIQALLMHMDKVRIALDTPPKSDRPDDDRVAQAMGYPEKPDDTPSLGEPWWHNK